jgi:hypothetical protein
MRKFLDFVKGNYLLGCAIVLFAIQSASAQDVKVVGGFLSDSLKIGEQTAFYVSARYKSDLSVLFPDSSASAFVPFEFQRKVYFPTRTENGVSFDSAVYYLTTFEVDRVQYLDLPLYVVQPQDCTEFRTSRDSVLITQLVAHVPDTVSVENLPLKMNTTYQRVFFELNTILIIIGIGVLVVIGIIVWLVFGKRISNHFATKRMLRNHNKFITAYNQFLKQLQSAFSAQAAEDALVTWKKYMEQLEAVPYTKLTTKETQSILRDELLVRNLREVDRSIYGHDTAVVGPLENLRQYADEHFSMKLRELKHGAGR